MHHSGEAVRRSPADEFDLKGVHHDKELIVLAFDTMDEAEQVHEALVKGKKRAW